MTEQDIVDYQHKVNAVVLDQKVIDYAVRLVRQTREHPSIYRGAGSHAIDIVKCSKAHAFLSGREFVIPDDVKYAALPVMRHRITLTPDVEIEGLDADGVLKQLLGIEAPR